MRLVDKPHFEPYKCALTLRADDTVWVDAGHELRGFDPRVYLSGAGIQSAARVIGWEDPAPLKERIAELERANDDLRAQMSEYDRELDAVYTLKNRGWQQGAKPGRPAKAA